MPDFVVTTSPDEFTIVDKTEDWSISPNSVNEITVELVAVGINDAAIAVAAAAAAQAAADSIGTSVADAEAAAAAAAASASAASTSEGNAATSETNAASSETAAEAAQAAAEAAVASIGTSVADAEAAATASAASAVTAAGHEADADTARIAAEAAQAAAEAAAALATSVIPAGGLTGEALVKASNADYDYAWAAISGVGDMTKAVYDPTNIAADAFDRANHTGTQLAATISDFSTAADARVSAAIGVTVQAYSAVLTTYAGINPSANVQSILGAANYAAIRALLDLEAGTDFLSPAAIAAAYQPLDADLTALAAANNSSVLAATTASFLTADETKLDGIEALADVTDAGNVGSSIHGASAKTTPVDADTVPMIDSEASNVLKKLTFANLWVWVQAKFNGTAKSTPVAADRVYIGDSEASNAVKYSTFTQIYTLVGALINGSTAKTTPTTSDEIAIADAAASNATKKVSLANLKTLMQTDPLITGTIREDVYTITDGAGFAIDPTNGSVQRVSLGANRTPVAANWDDGESVTLFIDDGTARTITWTTIGVVWKGGSAPALATSGYTEVNITKENGVYRGVHVGDFAS